MLNLFMFSSWRRNLLMATAVWLLTGAGAAADSNYYRHTFFDNSPATETYYYSSGYAVSPSVLKMQGQKLPVDSSIFFTPPNALRLSWQSQPGGSWKAEVRAVNFRNRDIFFKGNTLYFWLYSAEHLPASQLPRLRLLDTRKNFSKPLALGEFAGGLPAGKWTCIAIPVGKLESDSLNSFDPHRLQSFILEQGVSDSVQHTMFLDEIRIDDAEPATVPPTPRNIQAIGYERHVDITWNPVGSDQLARYVERLLAPGT
jgi:hypothetical protein